MTSSSPSAVRFARPDCQADRADYSTGTSICNARTIVGTRTASSCVVGSVARSADGLRQSQEGAEHALTSLEGSRSRPKVGGHAKMIWTWLERRLSK